MGGRDWWGEVDVLEDWSRVPRQGLHRLTMFDLRMSGRGAKCDVHRS